MAASNPNQVVLTAKLTRDPELRTTQNGTSVCSLRVTCNTPPKDRTSGEWVDKPNYFDITLWGAQADSCATFLQKGRSVAIDGRLEWREWEAPDGSRKRQAISIVAERSQFLGTRDAAEPDGRTTPERDVLADTADSSRPWRGAASPTTTTCRSDRAVCRLASRPSESGHPASDTAYSRADDWAD